MKTTELVISFRNVVREVTCINKISGSIFLFIALFIFYFIFWNCCVIIEFRMFIKNVNIIFYTFQKVIHFKSNCLRVEHPAFFIKHVVCNLTLNYIFLTNSGQLSYLLIWSWNSAECNKYLFIFNIFLMKGIFYLSIHSLLKYFDIIWCYITLNILGYNESYIITTRALLEFIIIANVFLRIYFLWNSQYIIHFN